MAIILNQTYLLKVTAPGTCSERLLGAHDKVFSLRHVDLAGGFFQHIAVVPLPITCVYPLLNMPKLEKRVRRECVCIYELLGVARTYPIRNDTIQCT